MFPLLFVIHGWPVGPTAILTAEPVTDIHELACQLNIPHYCCYTKVLNLWMQMNWVVFSLNVSLSIPILRQIIEKDISLWRKTIRIWSRNLPRMGEALYSCTDKLWCLNHGFGQFSVIANTYNGIWINCASGLIDLNIPKHSFINK